MGYFENFHIHLIFCKKKLGFFFISMSKYNKVFNPIGVNEETGEEIESWEEVNIHELVDPEKQEGGIVNALLR